jgi:hypothetical protein
MTIYSIKINKHEIVKTTALHEAINLAKKVLKDKIIATGSYPTSVCEKMYINNGRPCYRVFATVYVKDWQGIPRLKTYSNSIRMEDVPMGGYNFTLHGEICEAIDKARKIEGAN